jgi:hypothetical protein
MDFFVSHPYAARHFVISNYRFMSPEKIKRPFAGLALLLATSAVAAAQPIGVRAAGLANAFVAVADDASSVYWNPAGMATGAYVSFVLDYGDGGREPESSRSPEGAFSENARLLALTLPPMGLSYYRLSTIVADPQEAAVGETPNREEGRRTVHGLATNNVGLTLAQSINDYVVVAGTVRYVNGEARSGTVEAVGASDALDQAHQVPRKSSSRADVDAGVMVAVGHIRLGLVARNLAAPSFDLPEPDGGTIELERDVRVGAAWGNGWPGTASLIVSFDADLTERDSATGERRDLAAGVETWWFRRRLGVRGGVRGSTSGVARTTAATGMSVAVRNGVYVEAHLATGEAEERSWSVGGRLTF